MGRNLVGMLVVGVIAVSVVSGCGSADDPPAGASGSASGSSSGSASASATGGSASGTSAEATKRATSATQKALLPTSAFAKIGMSVSEKPRTARFDWFDTCRPTLPSESRQVVGTAGEWEADGVTVSQTVVAYPDGVGEAIVGEVAEAVTCPSYSTNGHTYSAIEAVDLPKVDSADATHAWCMVEKEEDVTICHSVLAAQDLVSSLWVRSGDAGDAKDAMTVLSRLAFQRITTQIG